MQIASLSMNPDHKFTRAIPHLFMQKGGTHFDLGFPLARLNYFTKLYNLAEGERDKWRQQPTPGSIKFLPSHT